MALTAYLPCYSQHKHYSLSLWVVVLTSHATPSTSTIHCRSGWPCLPPMLLPAQALFTTALDGLAYLPCYSQHKHYLLSLWMALLTSHATPTTSTINYRPGWPCLPPMLLPPHTLFTFALDGLAYIQCFSQHKQALFTITLDGFAYLPCYSQHKHYSLGLSLWMALLKSHATPTTSTIYYRSGWPCLPPMLLTPQALFTIALIITIALGGLAYLPWYSHHKHFSLSLCVALLTSHATPSTGNIYYRSGGLAYLPCYSHHKHYLLSLWVALLTTHATPTTSTIYYRSGWPCLPPMLLPPQALFTIALGGLAYLPCYSQHKHYLLSLWVALLTAHATPGTSTIYHRSRLPCLPLMLLPAQALFTIALDCLAYLPCYSRHKHYLLLLWLFLW